MDNAIVGTTAIWHLVVSDHISDLKHDTPLALASVGFAIKHPTSYMDGLKARVNQVLVGNCIVKEANGKMPTIALNHNDKSLLPFATIAYSN